MKKVFIHRLPAAIIGLTCVIVFLPALKNGFVGLDDGDYVYNNPHVQSLSLDNFLWFLTHLHSSNWHPLTSFSYMVDHVFWGLNPYGYHLSNLLLHSTNAVLVYLLFIRLFRQGGTRAKIGMPVVLPATVVALLFAVHPTRVESVAWISERKDLLYALFYLLALMAYLACQEPGQQRRRRYYFAALACFLLSLMSKPMAVSLPFVLLLLDLYPLNRCAPATGLAAIARQIWPLLREKILFVVPVLLSAAITMRAQAVSGAVKELARIPLLDRLLGAVHAYAFYLWKLVWPVKLAPFYPHPAITNHEISAVAYGLGLALFLLITGLALWSWRRNRLFAVLWGVYLVTLLPTIGLIQVGAQFAADRYTYLPLLAPLCFLALAVRKAVLGGSEITRWATFITLGAFLVFCVAQTRSQIGIWHDSIRFWTHEIECYPNIYYPYHSRALVYETAPETVHLAIDDYTKAIELRPTSVESLINRAILYAEQGQTDAALTDLNRAIELDNRSSRAFSNRGTLYHRAGWMQLALEDYLAAVRLSPDDAVVHHNLAMVYRSMGKQDQAEHHLQKARSFGLPGP